MFVVNRHSPFGVTRKTYAIFGAQSNNFASRACRVFHASPVFIYPRGSAEYSPGMDDRTPENRAPSEFAKDVENEPTGEVGRGAVGCVLIALGFAVGFAPFIIPGAFGGSIVAGWNLVGTLPVGLIIGLIGIIALATSGSSGNPAATTLDEASTPADSPDAVHTVDLDGVDSKSATERTREDTRAEIFPELPAWFGRAQIAIMALTFVGLLTSRAVWVSHDPSMILLMLFWPIYLPPTIGLVVSAVLFIRSLRLRFNPENRWSAREYGRLFRIQRAFSIPAYLSIAWMGLLGPTELAHSLIGIASNVLCIGMYAYYRRAIAKVSV